MKKTMNSYETPSRLAPIKAVICPLTKKDGLPEKAHEIMNMLKVTLNLSMISKVQSASGTIAKMKREHHSITVDHQSIKDDTVTVRYRDNQKQDRYQ